MTLGRKDFSVTRTDGGADVFRLTRFFRDDDLIGHKWLVSKNQFRIQCEHIANEIVSQALPGCDLRVWKCSEEESLLRSVDLRFSQFEIQVELHHREAQLWLHDGSVAQVCKLCQSERLSGLKINRQLEFRRLLDGEIAGFRSLEDLADVKADLSIPVGKACTITHEPSACSDSRKL